MSKENATTNEEVKVEEKSTNKVVEVKAKDISKDKKKKRKNQTAKQIGKSDQKHRA